MLSLFGLVYLFDIASILFFLFLLVKNFKEAELSFSLKKAVNFFFYEIGEGVTSLINFIHFSIFMGILLSTVYFCLSPLLLINNFVWYVLLVISLPFVFGLFVDIVWRVSILSKGLTRLEYLKVERGFMKESIISHVKVIIIIILTLANLLLLWTQEWFVVNSLIFVVRNIFLSIIFVKPFLNLLLNYDKPVHYFETPFKLKDIMEGRTKLENIKTSVETINDLSSRKKLSLSACLEIGVCEDVCPATSVLRPLSPRVFIRKLSILMQNKPEGNPFEVIGKDELWACTTCGACTSSCPLKVRHLEIILDLRRALVESGLLDEKKSKVLSNVVTYGNTFGMSNHSRNKWLEKLGVKTVDQNPNCKYLLWIGCLSSFDDRQRKIVEAFINILKHVGKVDEIAILGNLETCCGDPVRKLGDEGMFQEIALKNIELFEKYNVSSIITVCPHCYNVFKNEYRELDSREIKVIHHAEFLDMLFENKTLNNLRPLDKKIAVHDPCYLARYNRITPLMRRLEKVGSVRRPKKCGVNTYCCGGGGGNYWYEVPEKKRISHERLEQLLELKPDIIITFCPYCKAMLDDAAQAKELEHIKILDAAELISEQLKMV